MSSLSIIGTGNMASAIGTLAVAGGNDVEVIGRDQAKAADLAKTLGGSATAGKFGAVPVGDIVIVALKYADVLPVVTQYGDALADKVIVDISNPFNAEADGLAIPDDTSIAQQVAEAAMAELVKSLGLRPLDVGGLNMAHWLEGMGLILMGLARYGLGQWDIALGATEFDS